MSNFCDQSLDDDPNRATMRHDLAKLEEEIYQLKLQRRQKREEIWNMKRELGVSLLSEFFCEVKTGVVGLKKDIEQDMGKIYRDLVKGYEEFKSMMNEFYGGSCGARS